MRFGLVFVASFTLLAGCGQQVAEFGELPQNDIGKTSVEGDTSATFAPSIDQSAIPQLDSAILSNASDDRDLPKPAALTISSLGVKGATIRAVGVETNGDMEVPSAKEVGWYSFGSAPGEQGSVVMAAHIAENGIGGVFETLSEIKQGVTVQVGLDDGSVHEYEVTALAQYDKTELPFDDVFRRSGEQQLVLITCGGDFNQSVKSYEDNVVAYAKLAE